MSEHGRGYWESKLLVHTEEEGRHRTQAEGAMRILRKFYPESHLVSGGKEGGHGKG